jgi:phosphatidate cytidylyltransferase
MTFLDAKTAGLLGAVLGVLCIATLIGQILKRRTDTSLNPEVVRHFHLRIRAWWFMCAILAATFLIGREATVVLFGLLSFWALREFITLTPTRPGDHRPLFWVFFIFTPLQYVLVGMELYGLFSILIPVYAYLFIPARTAWAGDFKRFLERTAKIQFGLMICVYCLSYAPALLSLDLPLGGELPTEERPAAKFNQNARLLFYFVLIAQLGDVLQYVSEKLLGQHLIAPAISGNKTWEGFFGSLTMATLLGAGLWWATPFEPWEAAGMSMVIAVMGFAGGMTMSAIKRDRGVKDYGTLVTGHGGVLDRIDNICFAAPVFYHFARYFFEGQA